MSFKTALLLLLVLSLMAAAVGGAAHFWLAPNETDSSLIPKGSDATLLPVQPSGDATPSSVAQPRPLATDSLPATTTNLPPKPDELNSGKGTP
jgi:hypothetical protein